MDYSAISTNIERYNEQLRAVKLGIYADLREKYKEIFAEEIAMVAAAQILNYLLGEDIEQIYENAPQLLKSKIDKVKNQIPQLAEERMQKDSELREIVIYTLRMESMYKLGEQGESYLNSDAKKRIDSILESYNEEFPIEVSPSLYSLIVTRFLQERKELFQI